MSRIPIGANYTMLGHFDHLASGNFSGRLDEQLQELLEEFDLACHRGARIYAELVGYGMSADAYHITAPSEDGDGPFRVMGAAMDSAAIQPSQVDYINAHGTSTPHGDRVETIAIKRCFGPAEARVAIWETKWELLLPVVAFVALFGGFATPVEAAAVTALYAFVVETVLYRDLRITKDIPRVMTECGLLIGGVLLIWGVALGFTNYMVDAEVVVRAVEWTTHAIKSPWVFLLLLNLFLLLVGCLMDIYSAIVIQVPLLIPLGHAFHVSPIHLGIIFLANMELGYLTPPVGLNALLSSYRFKKPLSEVLLSVLPIDAVLFVGVLLVTYVPALTLWLPQRLGR